MLQLIIVLIFCCQLTMIAQDQEDIGFGMDGSLMYLSYDYNHINQALSELGTGQTIVNEFSSFPYMNSVGFWGRKEDLRVGLFVLLDSQYEDYYSMRSIGFYSPMTYGFVWEHLVLDVGINLGYHSSSLTFKGRDAFNWSSNLSGLFANPDEIKIIQSEQMYVGPALSVRYMIGEASSIHIDGFLPITLLSTHTINKMILEEGFCMRAAVGGGVSLHFH